MFQREMNVDELKRFTREIEKGKYLFHAGETGSTMFLLMQGSIGLYDVTSELGEVLISKVGWGQVFGEQAIVGAPPYRRLYSAKALEWARLLEFDAQDMKIIEKKIPDFTFRILQITSKWLDQTNRLIQVLKPMNETERLLRCVSYLANTRYFSETENENQVTSESIQYLTDIEKSAIEKFLTSLVEEKLLTPTSKGYRICNIDQFNGVLRARFRDTQFRKHAA